MWNILHQEVWLKSIYFINFSGSHISSPRRLLIVQKIWMSKHFVSLFHIYFHMPPSLLYSEIICKLCMSKAYQNRKALFCCIPFCSCIFQSFSQFPCEILVPVKHEKVAWNCTTFHDSNWACTWKLRVHVKIESQSPRPGYLASGMQSWHARCANDQFSSPIWVALRCPLSERRVF